MAKTLTITSDNGAMDESKRFEALKALQENANTQELQKLQKALKDPKLRNLLKFIN
ncbi:hypothetical protein [Cochleicola gelatinilyticus]|uniref:hypothetical protein n=1 Tax=Cochleicola gelatinilyticus TaxID=1763537 RepID=UPI0012FCB386|nr:hypothetical protein [Cochleicola gelatinilyticus]